MVDLNLLRSTCLYLALTRRKRRAAFGLKLRNVLQSSLFQ